VTLDDYGFLVGERTSYKTAIKPTGLVEGYTDLRSETGGGGAYGGYAYDVHAPLQLSTTLDCAALTVSTNNYAPTDGAINGVWRISATGAIDMTGIDVSVWDSVSRDGRVIILHNVGSNTITLKDESASSTAANRFALTADLALDADAMTMLQYDGTSERFRAISGGGGGGGGSTVATTSMAVLDADGTATSFSNSTAENTLYTYTIAANTLGSEASVTLRLVGALTNNTGGNVNYRFKVILGSTVMYDDTVTVATNANPRAWNLDIIIGNKNSTSAQALGGGIQVSNATGATAGYGVLTSPGPTTATGIRGDATVDMTSARNLDVSVTMNTASANASIAQAYAILILNDPTGGIVTTSYLTTKGDLLTRTSSALTRLGVGADGTVLTADSSTSEGIKWAAGGTFTEVEVDFGADPVLTKAFTVVDAGVVAASLVLAVQSGNAPTARNADENEMDPIVFNCLPAAGSFTLNALALHGPVAGKYKVMYTRN
jgi:hypothetical protein